VATSLTGPFLDRMEQFDDVLGFNLNRVVDKINTFTDYTSNFVLSNALYIPTSAGGTIAPSAYGSVPLKFDDQTLSGGSVTIPASGSIPSAFTRIKIWWAIRTTSGNTFDNLTLQLNGDTAGHYNYQLRDSVGTTVSTSTTANATSVLVGNAAGGALAAAFQNSGWIDIFNYASTTLDKKGWAWCMRNDGGAFGIRESGWEWSGTAAVTSITLTLAAGNFATGSKIVTEVYP
jgi:hypothetical protein